MNLIKKFWNEEDGQDLIEYALLAGTIALAVGGTMITIGTSVAIGFPAGIGFVIGGAGVACGKRAGAAAVAVAAEPQLPPVLEPHVGADTGAGAGAAFAAEPHVPLATGGGAICVGADAAGENVACIDAIARGFANGMTLLACGAGVADTWLAGADVADPSWVSAARRVLPDAVRRCRSSRGARTTARRLRDHTR